MEIQNILNNLIFSITKDVIENCNYHTWCSRDKNPIATTLKNILKNKYPDIVVYYASSINIFTNYDDYEYINIHISSSLAKWDSKFYWEKKEKPNPIKIQIFHLPLEYDPDTDCNHINWMASIVPESDKTTIIKKCRLLHKVNS